MRQQEYLSKTPADPAASIAEPPQDNLGERRKASRVPVIKSAKVALGIGQGVYNCLVLDESPKGVLVDFGALVAVPDEVTLQISNGAIYQARRRWSVGTKAGLEYIGERVVTGDTAGWMMKLSDILQTQGVVAAVSTLRASRFFNHEELRRIAEEAERAFSRLEAVLDGRQSI
jgi:hypothetical protein